MTGGTRIVAPFRPFPPETGHHVELADFDWIDAIRMMSHSAEQACQSPVFVLTDVDTDLPIPTLQYRTVERRLMLWYLEIAACYLESDDFDRDTIMLDSDQLIYGDLRRWFVPYMDLGIVIRKTPRNMPGLPILNGVQFWPLRGKAFLGPFFRQALAIAKALPEEDLIWGADTIALERLLAPLATGLCQRAGLSVRLIEGDEIIAALSAVQIVHLKAGRMDRPVRPVLDFRNLRKSHMRAVYELTFAQVPA